MTAVTVMPSGDQWMPPDREWTVDDLESLPDDGFQYELYDGVLVVSPAPVHLHQRGVFRLGRLLDDACPREFETLVAPLDFQPTKIRSLQPDVLVIRRKDPDGRAIHEPPLLVVEVLSPSTKTKDLVLKKHMYETSDVSFLWIFDPGLDRSGVPALRIYELRAGEYVEIATVSGADELHVDRPFPVSVNPRQLIVT